MNVVNEAMSGSSDEKRKDVNGRSRGKSHALVEMGEMWRKRQGRRGRGRGGERVM